VTVNADGSMSGTMIGPDGSTLGSFSGQLDTTASAPATSSSAATSTGAGTPTGDATPNLTGNYTLGTGGSGTWSAPGVVQPAAASTETTPTQTAQQ